MVFLLVKGSSVQYLHCQNIPPTGYLMYFLKYLLITGGTKGKHATDGKSNIKIKILNISIFRKVIIKRLFNPTEGIWTIKSTIC